jgi:hypothetical protein
LELGNMFITLGDPTLRAYNIQDEKMKEQKVFHSFLGFKIKTSKSHTFVKSMWITKLSFSKLIFK